MGFSKEEKAIKKIVTFSVPRWIKTVFFLTAMFVSLLLFSAPILLIIADALLPYTLLSASLRPSPPTPPPAILNHLRSYDFRHSLVDVPLVSLIRSAVILSVYSFCDGPRLSNGPYLAVATACSAASLAFVSLKVVMVSSMREGHALTATEAALFLSSVVLAVGHVVVAYRTRCRERRKLLVYKIDVEAVAAFNNGFPKYIKSLPK